MAAAVPVIVLPHPLRYNGLTIMAGVPIPIPGAGVAGPSCGNSHPGVSRTEETHSSRPADPPDLVRRRTRTSAAAVRGPPGGSSTVDRVAAMHLGRAS